MYVGNISHATTDSDLVSAFAGCVEAQITTNPQTGKSMGWVYYLLLNLLYFYSFGYVKYSTVDEAKAVFDKKEDIVLDGRSLFIDYGKISQLG